MPVVDFCPCVKACQKLSTYAWCFLTNVQLPHAKLYFFTIPLFTNVSKYGIRCPYALLHVFSISL